MKSFALFMFLLLLMFGSVSCFRQQGYPHEHLQASALEPLAKLQTGDYTLREGETLASIARLRYGHQNYYPIIKLYNHIEDETRVPANQTLKMPALSVILADEGLTKVIPQQVSLILCSRAKYDRVLDQLRAHQVPEDVRQQLLEAADDLQQVTESLKILRPGMNALPQRMIGQLEQCREGIRVFTDTGQFDSYSYDIDMVQQHFALALTYAIIWARDGFK